MRFVQFLTRPPSRTDFIFAVLSATSISLEYFCRLGCLFAVFGFSLVIKLQSAISKATAAAASSVQSRIAWKELSSTAASQVKIQLPSNIKLHTRHLKAGDPEPKLGPGILTLYSMLYCPYAQRTRLVLQHQRLTHQVVNVNLVSKPDWFLVKSPIASAKVPLLEVPSSTPVVACWHLAESLITSEYLDEARPEEVSALLPERRSYRLRALQRQIVARGDAFVAAFYRWALKRGTEGEQQEHWLKMLDQLEDLQSDIGPGGFFGATTAPHFADYMLWPWFERLPPLSERLDLKLPVERLGRLFNWISAMSEVGPVKETRLPDWAHVAFIESHWKRQPSYDFLD